MNDLAEDMAQLKSMTLELKSSGINKVLSLACYLTVYHHAPSSVTPRPGQKRLSTNLFHFA